MTSEGIDPAQQFADLLTPPAQPEAPPQEAAPAPAAPEFDLSTLSDPARRAAYLSAHGAPQIPYAPPIPQYQAQPQPYEQPAFQAPPAPAPYENLDLQNPEDLAKIIRGELAPVQTYIETLKQQEFQQQQQAFQATAEKVAADAAERVIPGISQWVAPPVGVDTRTVQQKAVGNLFVSEFQNAMRAVPQQLWTNQQVMSDIIGAVGRSITPLIQSLGLGQQSTAPRPQVAFTERSGSAPAAASRQSYQDLLAEGRHVDAFAALIGQAS